MLGARLITGRMTGVILPETAKKIPRFGRHYKFARATQPYKGAAKSNIHSAEAWC
jgi:hypothetical protein